MKKALAFVSILIILICGIYSLNYIYENGTATYAGEDINVLDIYKDPEHVDVAEANGVADIIVKEDLSKTMAANNVSAVVYDYRGYDTIGESFILLTAIAGSFIVLRSMTDDEKKHKERVDKRRIELAAAKEAALAAEAAAKAAADAAANAAAGTAVVENQGGDSKTTHHAIAVSLHG